MPRILNEEEKTRALNEYGNNALLVGPEGTSLQPGYALPSTQDFNRINSQTISNSPDTSGYKTPQAPVIYPVATLQQDPYAMNPEQEKAQQGTEDIQALTRELLGQTTYQAEQEQKYNIEGLTKTQNDLSSQLKAIQNEAQAADLAYNYTIPNQVQLDSAGRGMTRTGIATKTAGELRKNQIQQGAIASKALSINSLLEASRGNLATAQTMVEKAVSQKYDPIREQIEVAKSNLELLINSPAYTLAEKRQAQAQLDIQNAKLREIEQQEAQETEIKNYAIKAAELGADSLTLQKIQNAKTPEEALIMYAETKAKIEEKEQVQQMLSEGYTKISSPAQLAGLTEMDIQRMPSGDIYRKPVTETPVTKGRTSNISSPTQQEPTEPTGEKFSYGDLELSDYALNVVTKAQKLSDLTPSVRQKVTTELREKGFYSDVVPEWFKKLAQESGQKSIIDESGRIKLNPSLSSAELKKLWNEERMSVIGQETTTEEPTKTTSGGINFEDL